MVYWHLQHGLLHSLCLDSFCVNFFPLVIPPLRLCVSLPGQRSLAHPTFCGEKKGRCIFLQSKWPDALRITTNRNKSRVIYPLHVPLIEHSGTRVYKPINGGPRRLGLSSICRIGNTKSQDESLDPWIMTDDPSMRQGSRLPMTFSDEVSAGIKRDTPAKASRGHPLVYEGLVCW